MKINQLIAAVFAGLMAVSAFAYDHPQHQQEKASAAPDHSKQVLIKNVSIFDGTSEKLITGKDLVLAGNKIDKLIPSGGDEFGYDQVIDGKGGYLTPGLIDVHWHANFGVTSEAIFNAPAEYVALHASVEAEQQLLRGVTTIRDAGGNVFGLKKAIDEGLVPGPRIYPSGAIISRISGEAGAMADILIDSQNPLEDVSVVKDYEKNLQLIKDGKVHKNQL